MHVDLAYNAIAQSVLDEGELRQTRSGDTISTFGKFIELDLREGFPLLTSKKMFLRNIIGELIWFTCGETTISSLKHRTFGNESSDKWTIWTNDFERYSKTQAYIDNMVERQKGFGDLGPIYGEQWYPQLKEAIEKIKTDPTDRRILVNAYNVQELDKMALPPCHMLYQFYVSKDGYLDLMWYQRSIDIFLGFPYNIASYALLMHVVCEITGLKPRYLKCALGDAHLYTNSIDAIKTQTSRKPYPMMKLDTEKMPVIRELDDMKRLTADDFLPMFKSYQSHDALRVDLLVGE